VIFTFSESQGSSAGSAADKLNKNSEMGIWVLVLNAKRLKIEFSGKQAMSQPIIK
jgi:hypothetical protein